MEYAEMMSRSDMVPKDFKGKPQNILVAVQMGMDIGLPPTQAIQNIAVINGRPSLWGDAALAVVRAHPACEYIHEDLDKSTLVATCKIKRKGQPETVRTFSQEDAQNARLWGKTGPWSDYPYRMLQMRARSFAMRDAFPDALKGIYIAEEAQDIPVQDIDPGAISGGPSECDAVPQVEDVVEVKMYPGDDFDANLTAWRAAITSGKRTADEIIDMVQTKGTLTEEQKTIIRGDSDE
jgi:hypothetical protein